MTPPSSSRFQQKVNWTLLVALILAALLLQARWMTQLDHGGENSEDESDSLAALVRYSEGQPLYLDYRQPPYLLTPYMPLFYTVPGTVARWAHCDKLSTIVVGRSYVYACWLGIGWLIYLLARQAGADRFSSTLAAVLWFVVEIAPSHGVSYRPDAPQLFFSLAAIGVYLRSDRWTNLAGATVLLVIAFLHKQSAIAPMLALFACGWFNGRRWRVLAAGVAWTALIGAVLFFLQWRTGGLLVVNCFQSLGTAGSLARVGWVLEVGGTHGLPGLLGGLLGCFISRGSAQRVWRWYFVLAFGLALSSSSKFGSSSNYYLEPFAAGCVLTAVWLTADASQHAGRWLLWLVTAGIVAYHSLSVNTLQWTQWSRALLAHGADREQERREWDEQTQCLGLNRAPLLIEDPYLAIRQPGSPYLLNGSFLDALQKDGHFDDSGVLRDLNAARFPAIVTVLVIEDHQNWRHFPVRWLNAIQQHYRLARTCRAVDGSSLYVYLPVSE